MSLYSPLPGPIKLRYSSVGEGCRVVLLISLDSVCAQGKEERYSQVHRKHEKSLLPSVPVSISQVLVARQGVHARVCVCVCARTRTRVCL